MRKLIRSSFYGVLLFAGMFQGSLPAQDTDLPSAESRARKNSLRTPIKLVGRVLDAGGQALPGATVILNGLTNVTDVTGGFTFKRAPRTNGLMTISAPGFRDELLAVNLAVANRTRLITLNDIPMTSATGAVRIVFAGDTMFGRRFLDSQDIIPRGQMPPDDTNAMILVSNPLPGSINAVQFVKPFYHEADFGVVNLETPVTDNPATPHPDKAFVFFTLPGSLPALLDLGVDYVSLGNNHVYDYLEQGIVDTRTNLDLAGLPHSGCGLTPAEAFAPYRVDIGGHPYSFLSACAVSGSQHAITYVADDTKGGAADARVSADLAGGIQNELAAGRIPIMQIHGGFEYTFEPSPFVLDRINLAAQAGAALVVCHHAHTAQGFGKVGNTFAVHCPGNLVIDQDRLETMLGLLVRVDIDGTNVHALRTTPVYIEDFRPRPIGGRLASTFLRRIGESSRPYGVLHYPYNNQGWVSLATNDYTIHDRTNVVKLTMPASGVAVLDLRLYSTGDESLVAARAIPTLGPTGLAGQMGRDLLDHGDFEDYDTDPEHFEAARWDVEGESRYVSLIKPFRGLACLRSTRSYTRTNDSVLPLRNRVRVFGDALDLPNKDLSLFGYISAKHAGAVHVVARIGASVGDKEFGDQIIYQRPAGSYKWQPFLADISLPPEDPLLPPPADEQQARAVRVFFRHSPPSRGSGVVGYDELAIVNWEESFDLDAGGTFAAPHPRDFVRVTGASGVYTFEIVFRSFRPVVGNP
jgi:poly-gamma-glutamate capsule biosynthesis protein CapA/YwtB (metallophosphatase superfamily)